MMKLIIGVKGTGKTKQLIEMVNQAAVDSKGAVICIEQGNKLNFDITYKARLIDTANFGIDNAHKLMGFVSGISASNHDITHLFIDGAVKICGDIESFAEIADMLAKVSDAGIFELVVTASVAPENLPESLKKYL